MKKTVIGWLMVAVTLAVFVATPVQAEIRAEIASPMSGQDSLFGKQMQQDAKLDSSDLNATGGVQGEDATLLNPGNTEKIKVRAGTIRKRGIRSAQATVAPSCPTGYVFSGGQCIRSAGPVPTCPTGHIFSGGKCVVSGAASAPIRTAPIRQAPTVDLAFELQTELKRIGCLTGRVDGTWGGGSRAALARFSNQAGLRLGREPSQLAIDEARRTAVRYCQPVRRAAPKRTRKKKRVSASNEFAARKCNELWYKRNEVFARYGYCFKTARGRKAFHNTSFPNVCSPPFGKLPSSAKAEVSHLKRLERQNSCR